MLLPIPFYTLCVIEDALRRYTASSATGSSGTNLQQLVGGSCRCHRLLADCCNTTHSAVHLAQSSAVGTLRTYYYEPEKGQKNQTRSIIVSVPNSSGSSSSATLAANQSSSSTSRNSRFLLSSFLLHHAHYVLLLAYLAVQKLCCRHWLYTKMSGNKRFK